METMMIDQKAIDIIKKFEGFRAAAYHCPAGVLTIGYGHTSAAGAPRVTLGQMVTKREAEDILRRDLAKYAAAVDAAVRVPMTPSQRGALISLCYNIGAGAFRKSTAVRRLNAGDYAGCAEAMTWWNKAGGKVLRGLVRRREAERALFLSGDAHEDAPAAGAIEGGAHKPLAKTKTSWLGGLTFAGALASLRDVREAIPEVADYLPWALAAVGVLVILNRWNEARRGEH